MLEKYSVRTDLALEEKERFESDNVEVQGVVVEEHYDEHYKSEHQPIEVMQANMTNDELIGFLRGNIIKYALRFGRKDDTQKEAAKIKRYAEWLVVAVNGETINPRE